MNILLQIFIVFSGIDLDVRYIFNYVFDCIKNNYDKNSKEKLDFNDLLTITFRNMYLFHY